MIPGIPECVWYAAGLDQRCSGPGLDDLLCDLRTDNAFQHYGVLILIPVGVDGRAKSRGASRCSGTDSFLAAWLPLRIKTALNGPAAASSGPMV